MITISHGLNGNLSLHGEKALSQIYIYIYIYIIIYTHTKKFAQEDAFA